MDIKSKTYFQIPPSHDGRCMFMGSSFSVNDIRLITAPEQGDSVLCYKFQVFIGYSDEFRLEFKHKKKGEALSAMRELSRAWCRSGEFNDKVDTSEENSKQ